MNTKLVVCALSGMIFVAGCASVDSVLITSVNPDEINYGKQAVVKVQVKLDGPAGANGFKGKIELWDDDGLGTDDKIKNKVAFTIPRNKTRLIIPINIQCTDNGELKGDSTDTDDGTAGEVREYELYANETQDNEDSSAVDVKCIPLEEEESPSH